MNLKKKNRLWLLCGSLLLLLGVLYCNIRIEHYAKTRVYDEISDIPHRQTALVLGTSPTGRNGKPNRYFITRINACADLFHAGKIDRIIVSGDNRHASYNEPEEMRKALVEKGIPDEIIYLDYAGFRTFDSVIRAKEIFGQTSFIVISQRFHNERAVFIAGKKGIDAIALNADDISYGFLTHVREWFARCKVFLDLLFGKRPHFLGEPIDIMRPRPTAMSQQLYEQIIGHVAYEKAQADYAYPDSLTCAGVWFDSRAETDSLYILGGPMAIPDDNFSNGEHFLGYIKDQGLFISFATIGEAFSDALKQHVDIEALNKDEKEYIESITLPAQNTCAWWVSSYSIGPNQELLFSRRRLRR